MLNTNYTKLHINLKHRIKTKIIWTNSISGKENSISFIISMWTGRKHRDKHFLYIYNS